MSTLIFAMDDGSTLVLPNVTDEQAMAARDAVTAAGYPIIAKGVST